ncbi:MAG: hypothetical protein UH685_01155 [Bacteroidaceae bacterium]|nr:hypothetical protein [Bacteroidaceae bacterium]
MKQTNKDKAPKRYIVIFVLMCLIGIYILGKALYTMLPPESDYWKEVGRTTRLPQYQPAEATSSPATAKSSPAQCQNTHFIWTLPFQTQTLSAKPKP